MNKLIGKKICNDRYTINKLLGTGGYGCVVSVTDELKGNDYALKIPLKKKEDTPEKNELRVKSLTREYYINKQLKLSKVKMVEDSEFGKCMLMDLIQIREKEMNKNEINNIAVQCLKLLQYIHECGYIHKDIKPENILIDESNKIHLIDFGISKRYLYGGKHVVDKKVKKFCGTIRYASINAHLNNEQSRRDDLECLLYSLVYIYYGKLPWQNLKVKSKEERSAKTLKLKKKTDITREMPKEFQVFRRYIQSMEYTEEPLYNELINMFSQVKSV